MFGESIEYSAMFTTLAAIGLLWNLILLICILKDPLHIFRNPSSYLIANLAIGDTETCAGQLVIHLLSSTGHGDTAEMMFNHGITFFGPDLSLMCLLCLAVERYLCIRKPILYRVHFTARKTACLIGIVWFLHILRLVVINYCIPRGILHLKDVKMYTLLLYALLVSVSLICNIATLLFMRRNESQCRALQESTGTQSNSQNPRARVQRRFVVTMVIVTSCVVMTIIPFTLLMFLSNFQGTYLPRAVLDTVKMIYFLNFVINPALYFWRMPRYRNAIIALLSCGKFV